MSPSTTHSAQGFKVTKTDDGKTIFHRVPIFAECERDDLSFGADWIKAAVAEAKQQEREGYLPPLHIRHHEPTTDQNDAVRGVGVFRILDASPLTLKGRRITAVFADLIITDEVAAEELGRMKYPYRSVEIFEPEGPPKINCLALLDHEAPYLELQMLFAGEIDDQRDPNRLARENDKGGGIPDTGVASAINRSFSISYSRKPGDPMLGSAHNGKGAVLLFHFPNEEIMPAKKTPKKKTTNFADDEGGEKKSEKKDDETENMEDDAAGGGGMDISAIVKMIESGEIPMKDFDAILLAIQSQSAAATVEEEEDVAAPAPAPGAEIMKAGGATAKLFAHQQGKIDALEAKDKARDDRETRTTAVRVAMKRLEGKPLGADLEKKLLNFHDLVGGNAIAFKEYVDTMARTAGEFPDDDSGENFSAQNKAPASAMKFQSLGGEAVDKATTFARQYSQLKGIRASEEAYVRTNMKHLGYEVEETATA